MLSRVQLSKLTTFVVAGWIFLIPSNLFLKFGENQAFVHGLLVDYLLPKLHVSDLLMLMLIILSWSQIAKKLTSISKKQSALVLLVGVIGIRQLFTPYPVAGVWFLTRICLLSLTMLGLSSQPRILKRPAILFSLVATVFFQGCLAIYQFLTQSSLIGYELLGEPDLQRGFGIATGVFNGGLQVLSYGTTAHPNVLAGTHVIYTVLVWLLLDHLSLQKWPKLFLRVSTICLTLVILYTTQSWAAAASLLLGGSIWFILSSKIQLRLSARYVGVGLIGLLCLTPFFIWYAATKIPDSTSLTRRAFLNQAAFTMWHAYPLLGAGLNQSTALIEEYSPSKEVVRFVQPPHHVGLLVLSEVGLIGYLLLAAILYYFWQSEFLWIGVFMLPILATDHYLATLAAGQSLLLLCFLFSSLFDVGHCLLEDRVSRKTLQQ
jgi:hypothetical protein